MLDQVLEQWDRPVGAVLADVVKAELAGRLQMKDGVVKHR
jgi:hypothetical protein